MKKLRKLLLGILMVSILACSATACGKKDTVGEINPKFAKIKEDSVSETAQIIELNNSMDYYTMKISKDVKCVYFYSIGYNSSGKLIDKSVLTTMPVGMETSTELVINATFPNATYPSYAVGFLKDDDTHEYYILSYDSKTGVKTEFVEEKEDFFIDED